MYTYVPFNMYVPLRLFLGGFFVCSYVRQDIPLVLARKRPLEATQMEVLYAVECTAGCTESVFPSHRTTNQKAVCKTSLSHREVSGLEV